MNHTRISPARTNRIVTVLALGLGAWGFVLGVGWLLGVIAQRAGGF